MSEQFWWYLARASGIVAWALLTASVLWGIFLSTDLFPKYRRPAWLLDLHRWLGGLTVGFVAVHMASLVVDSYIDFGFADLVVPYAASWKPGPVALGVVAMWGLVIVEVTSLAMKRLPKKVWRGIHLTSYLTFWLGSLHGTLAGTDATQPIYLVTSSLSVMAVIFAVTYRILNRSPKRRRTPKPESPPITADLLN
ncbi:MAG: ferric reductase-like transmembrane domain-containing protein [Acidimicrobiales bacterium]|jgi:methionine sulfoxide reductase heme-binding subunit